MEIDSVMASIATLSKYGVIAIAIVGVLVGGYLLYLKKNRKNWICFVWEKKADGKTHLVGMDILTRHRFNK